MKSLANNACIYAHQLLIVINSRCAQACYVIKSYACIPFGYTGSRWIICSLYLGCSLLLNKCLPIAWFIMSHMQPRHRVQCAIWFDIAFIMYGWPQNTLPVQLTFVVREQKRKKNSHNMRTYTTYFIALEYTLELHKNKYWRNTWLKSKCLSQLWRLCSIWFVNQR